MEIFCDTCGNKFNKPISHINRSKNNYCSVYCHNIDQQKTITKLCKFCTNPFSVRKSEEKKYVTCESKDCRYQNKLGKNNPNYKHGNSKLRKKWMSQKKYKLWRQEVLKRDNYTCLFCGVKSLRGLHVDHIEPWAFFPSKRYLIPNGRTLCKSCHEKTYKDTFLWKDLFAPHILVDLDGTLAYYDGWTEATKIGFPIKSMVNKVKSWLNMGKNVVIFTARVSEISPTGELSPKELFDIEESIKSWCQCHIGKRLLVTNRKTLYAEIIYDDRCIQVLPNTGKLVTMYSYENDFSEV